MSEQRKIEVELEQPAHREYDREVKVELWHNRSQTTALRINREEAQDLQRKLAEFLKALDA